MKSVILLAASLLIISIPLYAYAVEGTFTVDVDGTSVDVSYDAVGVDVIGAEADLNEIELILEVQVNEDPATLSITFERSFFDAKFGEEDDEFFVIADGDFIDLVETETTLDSRTLQLDLPLGTEEIEIFGTILSGMTYGEAEPVVEEPTMEEPEVMEEPEQVMEEPEQVMEEPEEVMEEPEQVMEEQPTVECGPGTVLKDGECVLDQTCGPGTHLEDGVCVLDSPAQSSSAGERPPMNQLIIGAGAAFVISIIVIIILWIISRGSRQKASV